MKNNEIDLLVRNMKIVVENDIDKLYSNNN